MSTAPTAFVLNADCLAVLRALPDNSVDAIVTDPPYGLSNIKPARITEAITAWATGDRERVPDGRGFMGKAWDSFVPPPAVWDECLRVLKPGGHLVAFAGSRTHDLMGLSIRMAGFEIRDGLAWLYGSGFPKSMNVASAVDKLRAGRNDAPSEDELRFCAWMAEYSGLSDADARRLLGSDRFLHARVEVVNTATKEAPRMGRRALVPTAAAWSTARPELATTPPEWVESLVKKAPTEPSLSDWKSGAGEGWGTALKPAFEPVTLARKPLEGTVAANVLKWGTGALNIDATRIGDEVLPSQVRGVTQMGTFLGADGNVTPERTGRWPANAVLDEHQAAALDEQSGVSKGRQTPKRGTSALGDFAGTNNIAGHDDEGGASRFFYCAKASSKERPEVDGVKHPTVKPLSLMRWLVRLVTPEGGTVFDPFAGSGTTLEAAMLEGFTVFGAELSPEYAALCQARIDRATEEKKA